MSYIDFYEYRVATRDLKIPNIIYNALSMYILSEIKNMQFLQLENKTDEQNKPIYILNNSGKLRLNINIKNKPYKIIIDYYQEKNPDGHMIKILRIYSENIKNIYKIVKYSIDQYINSKYKKGYVNKIQYDLFGSCKWCHFKVNIHKTRQTMFINKNMIQEIYDDISNFLKNEPLYKHKLQIPYKKGYIFDGLPGTGKTSLAYAISNDINLPLFKLIIKTDKLGDIEKLLDDIPKHSILLIDDADICLNDIKREITEIETDKNNKIDKNENFSKILDILDGYTSLNGVIVILTTNFIDKIDKALIRPGRIDKIYNFSYCQTEIIIDILNYYCQYPNKIINYYGEKLNNIKITPSELINTIIIPNLENDDKIIELLKNYLF